MSTNRQDFLGTACELQGMSIPEFTASFCGRCSQPECTRSLFGKTKFDQRVQNWHSRLFTDVPKMNEADPRFSLIVSKKFLSLDGASPSVSEWIDPKDVKEKSVVIPAAVPPSAPEAPVQATPSPRKLPVMNTPFKNGTMIGDAAPSKPAADPWAAPTQTQKSTETVIKPGSKIKLGGGGSGV